MLERSTRLAMLPKPKPKKPPSPVNQMRQFYKGEHREKIIEELVNNPVLCETVPEEIEELMKAVKQRRRVNGQDEIEQPRQPTTSTLGSPRPLPSRWS
jgi:hypothetical protein